MKEKDFIDGKKILSQIQEESLIKRENPLDTFCDFLQQIWMDNTEKEALDQWKVKVKNFPWYAENALHCLNWVVKNPPKNLVSIMEEKGWIYLYHELNESGEEPKFSEQEYLAWLTQVKDSFQKVYDSDT